MTTYILLHLHIHPKQSAFIGPWQDHPAFVQALQVRQNLPKQQWIEKVYKSWEKEKKKKKKRIIVAQRMWAKQHFSSPLSVSVFKGRKFPLKASWYKLWQTGLQKLSSFTSFPPQKYNNSLPFNQNCILAKHDQIKLKIKNWKTYMWIQSNKNTCSCRCHIPLL